MYVYNHFLPDDLLRELVFFNTFEELNLPIKGPMEDAGVVKLYEPSPTPCLYVAPAAAENMVGRVPLMPLFLAGNATPTIPHLYSKRKDSGFPTSSGGRPTRPVRFLAWNLFFSETRCTPRQQQFRYIRGY